MTLLAKNADIIETLAQWGMGNRSGASEERCPVTLFTASRWSSPLLSLQPFQAYATRFKFDSWTTPTMQIYEWRALQGWK